MSIIQAFGSCKCKCKILAFSIVHFRDVEMLEVGKCVNETIDLARNDTNCKERNAKDRAERRESRFRLATPEEIGHFSW